MTKASSRSPTLLPARTEDKAGQAIRQWHLPVGRWTDVLGAAGFGSVTVEIIDAPVFGKPSTVLVRASAA